MLIKYVTKKGFALKTIKTELPQSNLNFYKLKYVYNLRAAYLPLKLNNIANLQIDRK